jgi:hypothetical protein
LRVKPHSDTTTSSHTVDEYDIWRRWEDCLLFQDILEARYGVLSREKRRRLRAGKKDGISIHDRASSSETFSPEPNSNSVAKDIHHYLPRLSKRGTFFRHSQAIIDQREREFSALMKAFFQEDVPSLIQELRKDRVIRTFFGCWNTDHDIAVGKNGKKPIAAPDTRTSPVSPSVQSSFSESQQISPIQDAPSPAPACTKYLDSATSEDRHDTDRRWSWTPSPLSSPTSPFHTIDSHPRAKSRLSQITSDFPPSLSSSARDRSLSSRPVQVPHSPGLGTLPEDMELQVGPHVTTSSPLIPRHRRPSPISVDSPHRKCFVWQDVDDVFLSEDDVHDQDLLTPVDSTGLTVTVTKPTSVPSRPSSAVLSILSLNDDYSSPRTSIEWPYTAYSYGSRVESDNLDTDSFPDPNLPLSRDLLISAPEATSVEDDDCLTDSEETFFETYFGGPEPFFSPSEDGTLVDDDTVSYYSSSISSRVRPESPVTGFPQVMRRQEVTASYVDKPTGGFHVPSSWPALSSSKSPPPQIASAPAVVSSVPRHDMLVVKAVLDDMTVIFSAQRNIKLSELRQRLQDKFARTKGTLLPGAFALEYVLPSVNATSRGKRVRTMSCVDATSADWTYPLPLQKEEEWNTAAASCGSNLNLRVSYPTLQRQ